MAGFPARSATDPDVCEWCERRGVDPSRVDPSNVDSHGFVVDPANMDPPEEECPHCVEAN